MTLTQIEAVSVAMNQEDNRNRIKQIENYRVSQASAEDYNEFISTLRKE